MPVFAVNTDAFDFTFDYNPIETAELRSLAYEKLSVEDLRRIALWKLDRVLDVPEELLMKLRALTGKRLRPHHYSTNLYL